MDGPKMHQNIIPVPLGAQKHTVRRAVHTELKVKYIGDEEWWTALSQLLSILSSLLFIFHHSHSLRQAPAIMDKTPQPLPRSRGAPPRIIAWLSASIPRQASHLLGRSHLQRHLRAACSTGSVKNEQQEGAHQHSPKQELCATTRWGAPFQNYTKNSSFKFYSLISELFCTS